MGEVERLRQREADLEAQIGRLHSALARALAGDAVALADLRAAERRNSHIIDSAIDFAIIATDLEGVVTRWSDGARRVLGWSEDEMLGHSVDRFFTPEDVTTGRVTTEMHNALTAGRADDERWHQRKGGERFWASGKLTVLRDESGAAVGFVKVLRDQTEQRRDVERRRADAEFMRSVLASSSDCIKVLDLDGRLTFMSEGGQRVMEVSDFNAIAGCPWPDFWQGPGREQAKSALAIARAGGVGRFQGPADTVAGTPRQWDVQVTAIAGADGQPEKLLSISRDVTASWQAEAAMRASEAHWRGLFEKLQEGLIVGEVVRDAAGSVVDWRYLDVNPAWGNLVDIQPASAVGHTIRNLFPGIEDAWVGEVAAVVETGLPKRFTRQVGALGRWYDGRAFHLGGDRFAVLFSEITARRRAEIQQAALLELGDRLREALDPAAASYAAGEILGRTLGVSRAGYGTIDPRDEIFAVERDWNAPGVTTLAGTLRFREFGSYIEDLKRGDTVAIADAALDRRTAANAAELAAISAQAFINMPVVETGGFVALAYVNHAEPRAWTEHDITFMREVAERTRSAVERRRAEGSLRDLAASLEQRVEARTRELMATEEALRQSQKMEAVGQLTGGLAHDFNNLLTGITGSLDLMRRRIAQGRVSELGRYVDLAMSSAGRAAALTHRLLAFSRRQTLDPKPTEVSSLVAGMADLIRRTIGPSITLDIVPAPDAWTALVDPHQLENALLNLCINARDAMPDGGRLTVETANRCIDAHGGRMRDIDLGPYLVLSVTDTGTGMPPEVVERVFEPFFTTKPLGMGTGLGLSMIYGFTKQSGGQVRIHSQPGLGTTVTLYLPRHEGEATGSATVMKGPAALPRAEDGETVLVVDDEPALRLLVGEVLADLGYIAVEAADGAGGLRILQTDMRVDLLVTDVGLPGGMNGRQVADAARVLRPGLKVLFITGYAENAAVGNGHLEPGMAVLTKPFAMDELAVKIRGMIEA